MAQAPSRTPRQSWQVGAVRITKFLDCTGPLDLAQVFTAATQAEVDAIDWLRPDFVSSDGIGISSYHALVVETPTHRIIVDTCWGDDKDLGAMTQWSHRQTGFLAGLEEAGYPCDSFDYVLCTHLHCDHVGWNTRLVDGSWIPTFPRARYIFGRAEYEHWRALEGRPGEDWFDDIQQRTFRQSVQPVAEAGLVTLVESDHRICEEISLVPTPGHSPGHVSVRIESQGAEALITGDFAHHPSQLVHPEWGLAVDFDFAQACATRERIFGDAADRRVLVIGTHWAGYTAGHVSREGASFRLDPPDA